MSKSAKKSKGFKTNKTSVPVQPAAVSSEPFETIEEEIQLQPKRLELKTQIGVIHTELYERLLKPAFSSFALRHDDEPLRQIVESIVTSIAMHDAYEGYRKLDDIFQRYLYYLESIEGSARKSLDSIELSALCDYWRTQAFMTLIRDSSAIFELLLPDSLPETPSACTIDQESFFQGIDVALNSHLDPAVATSRDSATSRDLFDFAHGVSFPWLGYSPENIFGIQAHIPNEKIEFANEFAMASAEQTIQFDLDVQNCLNSTLFLDLVYAQHHKIYLELESAYQAEDLLPSGLCRQLSQRIKFDKTYQNAYDAILSGSSLTKPLHRSTRLDFSALNAFGKFANIIHKAANLQFGVYIFHYLG